MPVARLHGRDDRVDYVVVRTTGSNGAQDFDNLGRRVEPLEAMPRLLQVGNERRYDDNDGDDDFDPASGTPQVSVTMTLPPSQVTESALSANNPTETFLVPGSPDPQRPPPHGPKGGISQTTEHLLIAAGSIGATIIIVMVILGIHTMRKRGLTFAEAVKQGRYQVTRRGPPPPPPKRATWDKPSQNADYGSMRNDSVTAPEPVVARSGSFSSQRPLVAPQRNPSLNRTERSVSPGTLGQSFLLDSPRRNNSHRRNTSETPSSPVLPLQNQRQSASTRNTRSLSGASELQYPEPPVERALSPLPPPPTFKQFLYNRPSQTGRPGIGPMISRFSWTNSNAPQTPHDPNRDTNSHTVMRDSYMTQRSSIPRFRTVDSWVQQQSNRLEEQKLRDQFRFTQSTTYSTDDEREIPKVPSLPPNVSGLREAGSSSSNATAPTPTRALASNPVTPPPPQTPKGLPGKNIKHERHDTQATVETAPIFRQHPGTEVRFSTRSLVPSEILNGKMEPNVLS
ncbi:hypothetical protein CC78DRAFT_219676 [Lojkania enalia]|uniref:Uncharacterized protein n=1 Tax=Lojkania enalia TaxID=147567 RepID=A0A9P4KAM2_9PLEO|nr:hypothetical protein CC78DRAFT_219676 [Didymosphaeria enalia]